MLQAIAGYDAEDAASTHTAVADYAQALTESTASLRIGVPRAHFYEALHREIASAIETALSALGELTSSQQEIEIPVGTEIALPIHKAEAFAYHRDHVAKTPELYQPETLQRIRGGAEITASAYIEARREMDKLRRSVPRIFEAVDLMVTPTVPVPPPTIRDLMEAPESLRAKELVMTRNTRPFNLLGLPTISVPCGFTNNGLPIGLQMTGPPGSEAAVLRLANAYQRASQYCLGSLNSTLTMVATSTGRPFTV
jgi:aspartyl-tRNA(Asn)/glutamyl-tRNA(Gln) amidotransferase subunit A